MSHYYVLCLEKGEPQFLFALESREIFPDDSLEDRLIQIHAIFGGTHPTREFLPNNLWTEASIKKQFPDLPIEYINSPQKFADLKTRLVLEGWS